ncbi:SCAN domain-containing protein 3-like [Nothobranchius furzeri]|uniref:SCAN domain-containing protein 3-like n=1 Tax=Nothobranchius furzeri TaxID=105023 RepID=UPI0039048093
MSQIMHGDKQAQELKAVPLSDGAISRRITEMAQDIKSQLIDRVKRGKDALQLEESIDVANSAQLLVFVRYSFDGKLHEDMRFCTTLSAKCTDGAAAMLGKNKGLKARVVQVAPHINSTRCMIHREVLENCLLLSATKWDQSINVCFSTQKSGGCHGETFSGACLSCGTRLAHLACIFDKLNGLNTSVQVENANIVSLNDKINAFKRKLDRWAARGFITMHLQTLLEHFIKFFAEEKAPEKYDWIRSPFTVTSTHHLSSDIEDALVELSSDRTLKSAFNSKMLAAEFWISVEREYPQLSKAAIDILMPFGSTYLCEKTFSTLTYIKNKYRSRLNVQDDLRVAMPKIKPRMDLLGSKHIAHPSHTF